MQTAAPSTGRFDVAREASEKVMIFALIGALVYLRMPGRLMNGFLWAEDAPVFLFDANTIGIKSLWHPYAGYLHLLPRIIVYGFGFFIPMAHAPLAFAWTSALILCYCCTFIFGVIRRSSSFTMGAAFAMTPLLIPHSGEVWLTVTNLQWVIAPALLLLLWEEFCTDYCGGRARSLSIALLSLTGPFGMIFFPVICVGICLSKKAGQLRERLVSAMAYLFAIGVQAATLISSSGAATDPSHHHLIDYLHYHWVGRFLRHFIASYLFTDKEVAQFGMHWPHIAGTCLILSALCALMSGKNRVIAVMLLLLSAALWAMGIVRTNAWTFDIVWWGAGARYFYIPFVLTTWSLIIAAFESSFPLVRMVSIGLLCSAAFNASTRFDADILPAAIFHMNEATKSWHVEVPPNMSAEIPFSNLY